MASLVGATVEKIETSAGVDKQLAAIGVHLEPPGFLGLHYGYRTPVVPLLAQTSYGVILGVGFASFFH